MLHALAQLNRFAGTLLTDGYAAYTKTVETLNKQDEKLIHANGWAYAASARIISTQSSPDATYGRV